MQIVNKVVVITDGLTPYRVPLFNTLNRLLNEQQVALKVIFAAERSEFRLWKIDLSRCEFDWSILGTERYASASIFFSARYPDLIRTLMRESPDVCVVSGFSLATLMLWFLSWVTRIRYVIWTGSTEAKYFGWQSRLRRIQRRMLVGRATSCIAYGTLAKTYLEGLGVSPDRIHIAINTVDTVFFARETERERQRSNPASVPHFTYVGYLSPRKGVGRIIEAAAHLASIRSDFVVDVIGDGSCRSQLEAKVRQYKLGSIVRFHGYKQKEELPHYFARSRCFLFQSTFDIWGLVLNEAMAAALPALASIHAGATHDLIRDGVNGFVVDYSDTDDVVAKLNWILDNPSEAEWMGQNAQALIRESATVFESAQGFINALCL